MDKKTFSCEYCERVFNNQSNCKKHKLICKKKPTESIPPVITPVVNTDLLHQQEIQLLKHQQEIEILKLQLQLQQQLQQVPIQIPVPIQVPIQDPVPVKPPFDMKKYLKEDCKDAISLEVFIKNVLDKYTEDYYYSVKEQTMDKHFEQLIKRELLSLSIENRPFQITDSQRLNGYVKYQPMIRHREIVDDEPKITWIVDPDRPLNFYKVNKFSIRELLEERFNNPLSDKTLLHFIAVKKKYNLTEQQVSKICRNIDWYTQDERYDNTPKEFEKIYLYKLISKVLSYIDIIDY